MRSTAALALLACLTTPASAAAQSPTFFDQSGPDRGGLTLSAALQWRLPLLAPRPALGLRWLRDLARSESGRVRSPLVLGLAVQSPIETTDGASADRILASDGILPMLAGYGVEWDVAGSAWTVRADLMVTIAYHDAGQPLRDERGRVLAEQRERFWRGWVGAHLGLWWHDVGLHYQIGASRSLGIDRDAVAFDFPLSAEVDELGAAQRLSMIWAINVDQEPRPELYLETTWASPRTSLESLQISVVVAADLLP